MPEHLDDCQGLRLCDVSQDASFPGTGASDLDREWRDWSLWQREDSTTSRRLWMYRTATRKVHAARSQRRTDLFRAFMIELADTRASDLLDELATTYGMSWIDLSALVGVTIPAIRKWRLGGTVSPDNEERLRTLVAFLKAVAIVRNTPDPVNWLDERLVPGFAVTVKDLYSPATIPTLLQYASNDFLSAVDLLNELRPMWRTDDATAFEIRNVDGQRSLVLRRSASG